VTNWRRVFKDKAPRQRMAGPLGLRKCPSCGRMNGRLQRDDDDRCTFGHGCRRVLAQGPWGE
jgi:hypothetical protein